MASLGSSHGSAVSSSAVLLARNKNYLYEIEINLLMRCDLKKKIYFQLNQYKYLKILTLACEFPEMTNNPSPSK
jgi:hypothetical protein